MSLTSRPRLTIPRLANTGSCSLRRVCLKRTEIGRGSPWSVGSPTKSRLHRRQEPDGSLFSLPSICTDGGRSEEHTSELQSRFDLVCRLLLEKKKKKKKQKKIYDKKKQKKR